MSNEVDRRSFLEALIAVSTTATLGMGTFGRALAACTHEGGSAGFHDFVMDVHSAEASAVSLRQEYDKMTQLVYSRYDLTTCEIEKLFYFGKTELNNIRDFIDRSKTRPDGKNLYDETATFGDKLRNDFTLNDLDRQHRPEFKTRVKQECATMYSDDGGGLDYPLPEAQIQGAYDSAWNKLTTSNPIPVQNLGFRILGQGIVATGERVGVELLDASTLNTVASCQVDAVMGTYRCGCLEGRVILPRTGDFRFKVRQRISSRSQSAVIELVSNSFTVTPPPPTHPI